MIQLKNGYHEMIIPFVLVHHWLSFHLPLKIILTLKLQLQTLDEIYLSVMKQSLNDSFNDPSFFKNTSKFKDFFISPDNSLTIGTKLNYLRRDPVLKIVYRWIIEISQPVMKTHIITARPFLREY